MARTKEFDEDEVLDKAVNLFNCKGYNATSAQDLVDGLGISRSSLYDTYGDKRALFIKALQKYGEQNTQCIVKLLDETHDIGKTIKQLLQSAIEDSLEDKNKGCFMVNSTVEMTTEDSEISDIINGNMQAVEDAFYHALKRGQDAGLVSKNNTARGLARFFISTISGLRVTAKSGSDKKVLDDIMKAALSTLK
jgi:TetR/AcrR family transcriptional repressor of nem operon